MAKEKFETLHSHNPSMNKTSWYIILLFIPPIVFVLTLTIYYKISSIRHNLLNTAYSSDSTIVQKEKKGITINETEIEVEVADEPISLGKGLSDRMYLGENSGMLFVFPKQDIKPPFWMKDMNFSLDIVWINDNMIIKIDANVQPEPGVTLHKLRYYLPSEPIDYVLEVNGGFCEKNKVKVGDRVELTSALINL